LIFACNLAGFVCMFLFSHLFLTHGGQWWQQLKLVAVYNHL
jgi:hypothetical protein